MSKLRTLVFFAGWFAFTGAVGFLALPALLSRRATWHVARFWARGTLLWLARSTGMHSRVEGSEHLKGARIVACKHQSAWDTLMLWVILGHPVFILKRELYHIPVFGWYLRRSGQIGIDRAKKNGTIKRIAEEAAAHHGLGRTLVIFPEGTRLPPGERRPFHPGVGYISAELNAPVVPAALNAGRFWPKASIWKTPGLATLRFLSPLEPCGEDVAGWLKRLEDTINDASDELAALPA